MEIKFMFFVLLSLSLFINNGVSLNDLAQGHESCFGFHAVPRKLLLNPKVDQGFEDTSSVFENKHLSGESHKREEAATSSSKVMMQKGSERARMFTMDYSPVKKRRPVHN